MKNDNLYNDDPNSTSEDNEKQRKAENTAKTVKAAAKVAADAYLGPAGGAAVEALSKTKLGNDILNKGGEAINKMPGMAPKLAEKLGESGMADKVGDIASSKMGGGSVPGGEALAGGEKASKITDGVGKTSNKLDDGVSASSDKINKGVIGSSGKAPSFLGDKNSKDTDSQLEMQGTAFIKKAGIALLAIFGIMLPFIVIGLTIVMVITSFTRFGDGFGINTLNGETPGNIVYVADNKAAESFYKRVDKVTKKYQEQGKEVDKFKIVAVFHIISQYDARVTYKKMSTKKIEKIADSMLNGTMYDEELFKANLKDDIFKSYFDDYTDDQRERLVEEVFEYIKNYYEFVGEEPPVSTNCASGGTCSYAIKGFYISGSGNISKKLNITNLKVRLMQCSGRFGGGTWGKPLDEDLVDFEKYILGVAYQEIGPSAPDEAIKAQMVASRSFALARPTAMNNSLGKKLSNENGQWILQLSSCVADQVYCDPDKGCSAMNDGEQYGTVRTGTGYAKLLKYPLAQNHKMRTLAKAVEGEVLINSQGNIISTPYTNVESNKFISLAKKGMNYKQILLSVYNQTKKLGATDIQKMSCSSANNNCAAVTGEYSNWSQKKGSWINVPLGKSRATIYSAGCLVTSVAMLIAKSGVPTNVSGEFNPGSFVQMLNQVGGFDARGNFQWATVSKVAPRFQYMGKVIVKGQSKEKKLAALNNLLNQGYYVVAEVMGDTGQHWVAVNSITNNTINMMDPASNSTNMWAQYRWYNTSQYAYFKVT